MNDIIVAKDLTKRFDGFTAVDGIDISVREGEIYGFLGPNGAGKTTTIRMLTTILRPTDGCITIDGIPVPKKVTDARKLIGIVQQQLSLDKDISVRENIIHHALLHKIPRKEIKIRMEALSEMMELTPFLDCTVISLSGGWKKKTAIVCALIHNPKILFLDEPTAGLDTQSRHMLWDLIRMLNRSGTTILLTTHYIEEAETLCDRVDIINKGKIIAGGSPHDLCSDIGRVVVEYPDGNGVRKYRYFQDRASAREFADTFGDDADILVRKTNLEDVFLELTGRKVIGDFVRTVRV